MPSSIMTRVLRPLRGANLEVFKFGMYLMFPIGWMYYFGTNLDERFSVPDFWPTQAQSHKIPFEKDEIRAEVERMTRDIKARRIQFEAFEVERQKRREATLKEAGEGEGEEEGRAVAGVS